MSLLSFISFPREVDTSCIKSKIDKSKIVKVKDLKGTEWEKDYIGLPDNIEVYIGSESDSHELQVYEKHLTVSFKKVFNNQYIYSINALFTKLEFVEPAGSIDKILDEIEKYDGVRMSEEVYKKQSQKYHREIEQEIIIHIAHCRKQLYDLVKYNTNTGEIVEIFSGWVRTSDPVKLGPPKETRILDIEEVLISELLDLQSNLKIEILV